MSESFARVLERLSERGTPRGPDAVFAAASFAPPPRPSRRRLELVAVVFVLLVLIGSFVAVRSRSGALGPVAPVQPTGDVHKALAGSVFRVVSVTNAGRPADLGRGPIRVAFDSEYLRITDGCAETEGGYAVDATGFTTESPNPGYLAPYVGDRSCEPSLLTWALQTLFLRNTIAVHGERVVVGDPGGLLAVLDRIGTNDAAPLLGSRWWIWTASEGPNRQHGSTATDASVPSITFTSRGAEIEDLPCGSGFVAASLSGEQLTLGAPERDPACVQRDGGVQRWLLDALPGTFTVRYDGRHLTLIGDVVLNFHAAPA